MNIEEVREYALTLPGTTEDQAYGEDWGIVSYRRKDFPVYMAQMLRSLLVS